MAELERIANHLGDIGAICNDAAFALMLAHLSALRERVLRASQIAFGHRLMMDVIVPGGLARDMSPAKASASCVICSPSSKRLSEARRALRQHHFASGPNRDDGDRVRRRSSRSFGAGGYVGRASGRDFDARRFPGYPPYDALAFDVPVGKRAMSMRASGSEFAKSSSRSG